MSSTPTADAFFVPLGDGSYAATAHTVGPWSPDAQHAGPPSALLARAIEQEPGEWPGRVVRIVVDVLGPVPVGELDVATRVVRSGRSVELVEAELAANGRTALRASGWRLRRAELALPDTTIEPAAPVPPFPDDDWDTPEGWGAGYLQAMQWRLTAGEWAGPGPATMWARMRYPLVEGEEPTGLQRVLTLADSGNGISSVLVPWEWFFINTDLTIHLAADPVGEWICLDAESRVDRGGFGLASSRLFDRDRLIGFGAQSLFIGPR
jgi:hypothetical protein